MPIKYIGSKRKLVPFIVDLVNQLSPGGSVLDLFSGTSRVGHALKARGHKVVSNDYMTFAETIARCYVQADAEAWLDSATKLVAEMNSVPGSAGYFTETFCNKSRFFMPKNGERIDAIREAIAEKELPPELEAVMLVSLMEAADRVDSTTGLQMAYLKTWAPRASTDLQLRVPDLLPQASGGKGESHMMLAEDAARTLSAEVAYLDPPYNQHSYLGNYHIWESLVRWDKPEVYGIACKRVDCRERKSAFNRKREFRAAWDQVVDSIQATYLIVSFNNEGYISREDMESVLSRRGHVTVIAHDHKRYVGAQIGIHNPKGEKVGKVSHVRNKEYLYVVSAEAPTLVATGQGKSGGEQAMLF